MELLINLAAWEKLPTEYQEALKTATAEANITMLAKYDALNGAALTRLVAGGTQLKPYSDEIMAAAEGIAFEIYEQDASADAAFKEIYDGWKTFREEVYGWNAINELSFNRFVNRG